MCKGRKARKTGTVGGAIGEREKTRDKRNAKIRESRERNARYVLWARHPLPRTERKKPRVTRKAKKRRARGVDGEQLRRFFCFGKAPFVRIRETKGACNPFGGSNLFEGKKKISALISRSRQKEMRVFLAFRNADDVALFTGLGNDDDLRTVLVDEESLFLSVCDGREIISVQPAIKFLVAAEGRDLSGQSHVSVSGRRLDVFGGFGRDGDLFGPARQGKSEEHEHDDVHKEVDVIGLLQERAAEEIAEIRHFDIREKDFEDKINGVGEDQQEGEQVPPFSVLGKCLRQKQEKKRAERDADRDQIGGHLKPVSKLFGKINRGESLDIKFFQNVELYEDSVGYHGQDKEN